MPAFFYSYVGFPACFRPQQHMSILHVMIFQENPMIIFSGFIRVSNAKINTSHSAPENSQYISCNHKTGNRLTGSNTPANLSLPSLRKTRYTL
ncbi:MAG: hypothetical protein FD166_1316 [Bacteroidetes bacterium]|nr:MAG: hypothetical protein FD166_1316 [Bacteroidota bacterium]